MQNKSNNSKNGLSPLREIAANNSFSPSYVSILVQRKVLKAKKVGRNYFTTQEWFDDYLKNHSRIDRKSEDQSKKLLPLRAIAEANAYSVGYVSILVQRKVLKAKKVGRNYFTTQEWFSEYLKNHSREESVFKKSAEDQTSLIIKAAPAEQKNYSGVVALNFEELSNKITDKIVALNKNQENNKDAAKNISAKPLRPRHWAIKFFQTAAVALIIIISCAKLFPTASYHLQNLAASLYLFPIIKLTKLVSLPDSKILALKPAGEQIDAADKNSGEKGKVAGASEVNLGFTSIDEAIVDNQVEEAVTYFRGQFKKLIDFLNDNFYKFYLVFSNQVEDSALTGASRDRVISAGGQTNGQGAVIVPFKNDEQAQEIKQKIQNMFSDQVQIQPGETPREGIIQPVFGAEPADQKYLYMMVPVTEDKKVQNKQ